MNEEITSFPLSTVTANRVLNYLNSRPYGDVAPLIESISAEYKAHEDAVKAAADEKAKEKK